MKFLLTVAALTSVALTGTALSGLVAAPVDLSKYNLSNCTKAYLPYTANEMTGWEVNEERKYAYCVITTRNSTFFDYKCLCRGGDGLGSAIIDAALLDGAVEHDCGRDYSFSTYYFVSQYLRASLDTLCGTIQT